MRKCDEHQTLVHLDVHVCPVFVCVCVCVGGGALIYIYIYMRIPKKILKLKDFEPPKVLPPPPPPASMLVHEATVCRSVSFIWASKGFAIELVCWSV